MKSNAKGSFGKVIKYELRSFDDLLYQMAQCIYLSVLCMFFEAMEKNFRLSISNPCEDTGSECTMIQNRSHLLDKIVNDSSSIDSEVCNSDKFPFDRAIKYVILNLHDYPEEAIINQASQHAIRAQ